MKILLTFFVLFFSSSVVAELPTSLFGIPLNVSINNYIEEGDQINTEDSPDSFIEWFYYDNQIKNLIKNSNFENYVIFYDEYDFIVSIMGYKDLENINVTKCIEQVNNFSTILKTYYLLKKEFDTNFYRYNWFADYEPLEKHMMVVYSKKVEGVIGIEKYALRLSCEIYKSDIVENQQQLDGRIILELTKDDWFVKFGNKYDLVSLPDLDSFILHSEFILQDLSGL